MPDTLVGSLPKSFPGVRTWNDTILAPDETILAPQRNRLETFAG
jgi:hypothetical protein